MKKEYLVDWRNEKYTKAHTVSMHHRPLDQKRTLHLVLALQVPFLDLSLYSYTAFGERVEEPSRLSVGGLFLKKAFCNRESRV